MIILKFLIKLISKDNEKSFNRRTRLPFLSDKFKAFENHIRWEAKSQYQREPLAGDLSVIIQAHFKDKRHCDIGNLPKSCLDSLQGIAYLNDRQIKELIVKVYEKEKDDWFDIIIEEIK